ncbi:MAG: metallophosphoesterase [Candidatus Omnitrophota bacterium]
MKIYLKLGLLIFLVLISSCSSHEGFDKEPFSFIVTADMRKYAGPAYQTTEYFRGVSQAILKVGKGSFMVITGDEDPPCDVDKIIDKVLGNDYVWYPGVGNHEAAKLEDMAWLRNWGSGDIPNLVRRGPINGEETTYSFDFRNAHFIMLNQYYDGNSDTGTDGDIVDVLYEWLKNDLSENRKPLIFVFGHEPFVSIPDVDNGRSKHIGDSLDAHPDNNQRFQELLRKYNVTAYICGHTHNTSYAKINGLWQIDAGHSRGLGDPGVRSTFLKVRIFSSRIIVDIYRDDGKGGKYRLAHSVDLN